MEISNVNLQEKFSSFSDYWAPKIVNNYKTGG